MSLTTQEKYTKKKSDFKHCHMFNNKILIYYNKSSIYNVFFYNLQLLSL